MTFITRYRWPLIGVLAILVIIVAAHFLKYGLPHPVPEVTTFQSGNFSFTYPRIYEAQEYASGVVSVGDSYNGGAFIPLVDVVRYKPDPQAAAPKSFDSFVSRQVIALCGTDAGIESVSCANPVVTPYTTAAGRTGEEIMLTLNKRNLKTGTTSAATFGPIYVFETTLPPTATEPASYQGVFVYPNFTSFILVGTTSPAFVESIASTIVINGH